MRQSASVDRDEMITTNAQIKQRFKKAVIDVIAIGLFVLFIAVIWESWGETWHEFGRNLYHVFN